MIPRAHSVLGCRARRRLSPRPRVVEWGGPGCAGSRRPRSSRHRNRDRPARSRAASERSPVEQLRPSWCRQVTADGRGAQSRDAVQTRLAPQQLSVVLVVAGPGDFLDRDQHYRRGFASVTSSPRSSSVSSASSQGGQSEESENDAQGGYMRQFYLIVRRVQRCPRFARNDSPVAAWWIWREGQARAVRQRGASYGPSGTARRIGGCADVPTSARLDTLRHSDAESPIQQRVRSTRSKLRAKPGRPVSSSDRSARSCSIGSRTNATPRRSWRSRGEGKRSPSLRM